MRLSFFCLQGIRMKPSAVSAFCAAVLLSAAVRPAVAGYAAGLGQPPLYAEGFKHFGYVNPNAPKGGSFTLPVQGSFDTLNPFTLKGSAESGVAMLTVDTLMTEGGDDPFAMYGLLAQDISLASDGLSVTFRLNPKARFHNGDPVLAEDVDGPAVRALGAGHEAALRLVLLGPVDAPEHPRGYARALGHVQDGVGGLGRDDGDQED